MALGTNRDYVRTHRATKKALMDKFPLKMWECPECGRKHYPKDITCIRCGAEKNV